MKPQARVPVTPLLILVAVVLAAHWWALRGAAPRVRPVEHSAPFMVRTVSLQLPPAVPAAAPEAVVRPPARPPAPQQRTAPRPARVPAREEAVAARPVPNATPTVVAVSSSIQHAEVHAAASAPPAAPQHSARPSPAPSVHVAVPGSVRLHYQVAAQVRNRTWNGQGELLWRHDGDSYEAQLEVRALLLPTRRQRSTGRITAEGLAPARFSDKVRSEEAAHFERDKGKVSFSSNRPDAPLEPGAQDRLSVMLQLGAMIAGQPQKFPPGTSISIQTASTHDAEPWLFTVEGEEQLQLPGGGVAAIKLIRNPRREFDQKVELWLAPGMDYVPVRLRLTQPNGDSVDQQWSSTDRG